MSGSGPIRSLSAVLVRYGVAGAANTVLGVAVILGLDIGLGVHPLVANACGYAAGLLLSFFLSRGFVFRSGGGPATAVRYVAAVLVAFAANQIVVLTVVALTPDTAGWRAAGQLAGVVTYTILLFVLSYGWVFRPRR